MGEDPFFLGAIRMSRRTPGKFNKLYYDIFSPYTGAEASGIIAAGDLTSRLLGQASRAYSADIRSVRIEPNNNVPEQMLLPFKSNASWLQA